MRAVLFLAFLLCEISCVFGQSHDENIFAATEGEPSSFVEGCVSAITGDLVISEEDIKVEGYVPIHLKRQYISGMDEEGWTFCHHLIAVYTSRGFVINAIEPSGTKLFYVMDGNDIKRYKEHQGTFKRIIERREKEEKKGKQKTWVNPFHFHLGSGIANTGAVNSARGGISGRANIKNNRVEMDISEEVFSVYLGDGTERCYQLIPEQRNADKIGTKLKYHLLWELLPSKHRICYNYDKKHRLDSIASTSEDRSQAYASLTIKYPSQELVEITTSDGRIFQYKLKDLGEKHPFWVLDSITSTSEPTENLSYTKKSKYHRPLITRRSFQNGRVLDIDYYTVKQNKLGPNEIYIKEDTDPRCNRVKILQAPVGVDSALHPIYSFYYTPPKKKNEGGHTSVYDAFNVQTNFHYDERMQLTCINKSTFNGQGHVPFSSEKLVWGKDNSNAGNILCRAFLDGSGQAFCARQFRYDERGNVLEDRFLGNISGRSQSLILGSDNQPIENGVDCCVRRMGYTSDGRNLLKESLEPNGSRIVYDYLPNTDLITLKVIEYKGEVKQRTFYEYDKNKVLVREIQDDGNTYDKLNLSGVSERHIRVIHPFTSWPYVGLPKSIEEKYLDLHSGAELLLQKVEYSYCRGGKVSEKKIYDASGNYRYSLSYEYDAKGNLIKESNELGQVARSSYDDNGNKIQFTGFDGKLTSKMHYDYSNRLIQTEEYADGKCHITAHRYDLKNNKIATTDAFGNTTTFEPDAMGRIYAIKAPVVLTSQGASSHPILKKTHDCMGRETSITEANGETKYISYNVLGKPTEVLCSDGSQERFSYNLDGTLQSHIDQVGLSTLYEYDYLSRVTKKSLISSSGEVFSEETSIYNGLHLLATVDIEGNTTKYYYDAAGRLSAEEMIGSDLCKRTEYSYDSLGRIVCTIVKGEGLDLISYTERDLAGRVLLEKKEDSQGNLLHKVAYSYDSAGHLSTKTSFHAGSESQEKFFYDGFGRLISQVDALGHATHIEYDENYYNSIGQTVLRKITTDTRGIQTIEIYDALGKVVSTEQKSPYGQSLSLEEKHYDLAGHLVRQISHVYYQGKEDRQIETSWEYGALGCVLMQIEANDSDYPKITHYEYTSKGLVSKIIKPDGICLSYTYDPMGRMVALFSSDGSCSYEFVYNSMHQMTHLIDKLTGKMLVRSYNSFGQMTKEILPDGNTLENAYDIRGRREELTLPDGSNVSYNYDALYLREVDRKSSSGALLYSHTYDAYDLSGAVLAETHIAGIGHTVRSLDLLGRIDSLTTPCTSQDHFVYDNVGHLLSYQTQGYGGETFSYDEQGQLVSEEGSFSHNYQSDSLYNRREKDASSCNVNDLNQLLSDSYSDYTYDRSGNLRCKRNAEEEILYDYDALDRLTSITKYGSYRLVFEYDGLHRRTSTSYYDWLDDQFQLRDTKYYLYDGQNEIGSANSQGEITELRVLGPTALAEIGSAVAIELQGAVFAPIHDFRGNVIALVDTLGQIAEEYCYSAFGEERILDPTGNKVKNSKIGNFWRFASKRVDEETGLIYFGRRFYDPQMGRWITCDPKGFTDSMNLYAFVMNNPLTNLDLYGLEALATEAPTQGWWSRSWDAGRAALRATSNLAGSVIYNFFHHAVPIPILRDVGRYVRAALKGERLEKETHSASYVVGEKRHFENKIICLSTGQVCDPSVAIDQGNNVSQPADGEIVHVYHNSTRGLFLDTLESIAALLGFRSSTIDKTTKWMRDCIDKVGGVEGDGVVNWIVWSQGAIMAERVLKNLTPEERKHIVVRGIGSGSLFNDKEADVQHYVAPGDIVPQLSNPLRYAISLFSRKSNVNFLPATTSSWLMGDHSFNNAAYADIIETFGKDFVSSGGRL